MRLVNIRSTLFGILVFREIFFLVSIIYTTERVGKAGSIHLSLPLPPLPPLQCWVGVSHKVFVGYSTLVRGMRVQKVFLLVMLAIAKPSKQLLYVQQVVHREVSSSFKTCGKLEDWSNGNVTKEIN